MRACMCSCFKTTKTAMVSLAILPNNFCIVTGFILILIGDEVKMTSIKMALNVLLTGRKEERLGMQQREMLKVYGAETLVMEGGWYFMLLSSLVEKWRDKGAT